MHPKRFAYQELATFIGALASPVRLELLDLVAQGERSVEAIAAAAELGMANASQHLHALRRAGLLVSRKNGRRVLWRLGGRATLPMLAMLRGAADETFAPLARVLDRHFRADGPPALSPEALRRRLASDPAPVLLDVRPTEEYAAGHLPGAVGIPVSDLRRRHGELPRGADVIAYCRGPYCRFAFEAQALLASRGIAARRLEGGFLGWLGAGLPVERAG